MKRQLQNALVFLLSVAFLGAFVVPVSAAITFPINGGTGSSTLTGLLKGNGTSPVQTTVITAPLLLSGSALSIPAASASTNGYLTAADWVTFNSQLASSSFSAVYPLQYVPATGIFSLLFGTTTTNTWSNLQTFVSGFVSQASSTVVGLFNATNASTTVLSASSAFLTTASTTNLRVSGSPSGFLQTSSTGLVSATSTIASSSIFGVFDVPHGGTASTTLGGILTGNGAGAVTAAAVTAPLSFSANTLSIPVGTASQNGYITSTDWTRFNGKIGSTTISALTTNFLAKWNGSAFVNSAITDTITNIGVSTTSPGTVFSIGSIANFTTATTTLYSTGVNIKGGCFAVNGVCAGSASFQGSTGQVDVFTAANTARGTSTIFMSNTSEVMVGTSTDASGVALYVSNALQGLGGLVIRTWTNTVNAFSIISANGTTAFNVDTTATRAMLLVGTTTSFDGSTVLSAMRPSVGDGSNASTTVNFGDVSTSTSRAQINMRSTTGAAVCVYVVGTTVVASSGACEP